MTPVCARSAPVCSSGSLSGRGVLEGMHWSADQLSLSLSHFFPACTPTRAAAAAGPEPHRHRAGAPSSASAARGHSHSASSPIHLTRRHHRCCPCSSAVCDRPAEEERRREHGAADRHRHPLRARAARHAPPRASARCVLRASDCQPGSLLPAPSQQLRQRNQPTPPRGPAAPCARPASPPFRRASPGEGGERRAALHLRERLQGAPPSCTGVSTRCGLSPAPPCRLRNNARACASRFRPRTCSAPRITPPSPFRARSAQLSLPPPHVLHHHHRSPHPPPPHAAAQAPGIPALSRRIEDLLDDDVCGGSQAFQQRARQVFAVRGGADCYLDMARKAYCEAAEAIHALRRDLEEETGMPIKARKARAEKMMSLFFACAAVLRRRCSCPVASLLRMRTLRLPRP